MGIIVKYKATLKDSTDEYFSTFKQIFLRDLSWGTFTKNLNAALITANISDQKEWEKIQPQINTTYEDGKIRHFDVVFSRDQFNLEKEGINHFIGTIAGDVIRNRQLENIIIDEIIYDDETLAYFHGPCMGIEELKSKFFQQTSKNLNRPILAFSIKPRCGYTPDQYELFIKEACEAGIDLVEDDERLVDPIYCSFEERVAIAKKYIAKFPTRISLNVTGNPFKIEDNVKLAYDAGIRVFKLDVLVAGFDVLFELRRILNDFDEKCIITVFPDVYGEVYRSLDRKVILYLSRVIGADIIYAGSPNIDARMGAMTNDEKIGRLDAMKQSHDILQKQIKGIKGSLPTITHDVHPSRMENIIYQIRCHLNNHLDFAFFIGGGIAGFPANKSIKESCELFKDVLEYSSQYNLNILNGNLENIKYLTAFDFSKYHNDLDGNDWSPLKYDSKYPYKLFNHD